MTAGDCTFCAIVGGVADAEVVMRTDAAVAFLDHRPLFPGHCLVVPPAHVDTLLDLPYGSVGAFFGEVQRVTAAVTSALECEGTFVAMNNRVSQSVPHLHVHVVPRNRRDGLRGFFWPRNPYEDDAHRRAVADRLRAHLAGLRR